MSDPEVAGAVAMWLRYAREDLTAAQAGLERREGFVPRQVCFDAQQAAEKALKARYVAQQREHEFVHDLDRLAAGLEWAAQAETVEELRWLSRWAKAARYPFGEDADWSDAEQAVALARRIVEAAAGAIEAAG